MDNKYDVIVVGAGHAGIEASVAAARLGCRVLLLTMDVDKIGAMSCNPAIGGIGKGQLVREIDALGGVMGRAADACGIQFRRLNASKGPAVRSSRAQEDMFRYQAHMKALVERQERLEVAAAEVAELLVEGRSVTGVRTTAGADIFSRCVVVTPGTFLNGLVHIGLEHTPGGRIGEKPSVRLSENLKELGFTLGRFKTGTCPRIDSGSIDVSGLVRQDGDAQPSFFSFGTTRAALAQVPCYLTYTNERTHAIIRSGLDRSPLYTGKIKSTGVRYCPSIEDKIVRFADRDRHQVFLEPEGLDSVEVYPNGVSTSLPLDVQTKMIRSMAGLERARIVRPGYGIEYDRADPTELYPTLETKLFERLYFAGQLNGTTGYEEAGAQGLVAGINAALKVRGDEPFILGRDEAYIGVLIDDLVTRGTNEPYRMFTSRVEYRLILREDNADLRLREKACRIGLCGPEALVALEEKKAAIAQGLAYLASTHLKPVLVNERLGAWGSSSVDRQVTLEELLRRPEITFEKLMDLDPVRGQACFSSEDVVRQIETSVKYEGFVARMKEEVARFRKVESIKVPPTFDYRAVRGLSREIVEKMEKFRPVSLGQAARISGMTPAALSLLRVYIERLR